MNGILVIDKPPGLTSHDIVNIVRKSSGVKKVGHTGTLDPMATGVLVLSIGQATRIGRFLELDPKEYIAEALFGIQTDTQDITGNILSESDKRISLEALTEVLDDFTGNIQQVPPMVSAVKVGGKPLYKLARQGKEIERAARNVTIYKLDLLNFSEREGKQLAELRVVCSAGTYVRTIVHDIGERLGVGATLSSLRRTRVGRYTLTGALSIDDVKDRSAVSKSLISMDSALAHLPEAIAQKDAEGLILNGHEIDNRKLASHSGAVKNSDFIRIKSDSGALLAIGQVRNADSLSIKPEIVFKQV